MSDRKEIWTFGHLHHLEPSAVLRECRSPCFTYSKLLQRGHAEPGLAGWITSTYWGAEPLAAAVAIINYSMPW